MRNRYQSLPLLLFLLIFAIPVVSPSTGTPGMLESAEQAAVGEAVPSVLDSEVGTTVTLDLRYGSDETIVAFDIHEDGKYELNWSYHVDWAPESDVSLYADYYYSSELYVPQLDDFAPTRSYYDSRDLYALPTGAENTYLVGFSSFDDGYFIFGLSSHMYVNSSATVNVTVNQVVSYIDLPSMSLGGNYSVTLDEDYATNGTKMAVSDGMYLLRLDVTVPYETGSLWGGGDVYPGVVNMYWKTHGSKLTLLQHELYDYLEPGASAGFMTFHFEDYIPLESDTYYIAASTYEIEWFNCTQMVMTTNVARIESTPLVAGTPLNVIAEVDGGIAGWFSFSPDPASTYAVSLQWLSGGNWSAFLNDVFHEDSISYITAYEDSDTVLTESLDLKYAASVALPGTSATSPSPSLMGDSYIMFARIGGAQMAYANGTLAEVLQMREVAYSYTGVYYFYLIAETVGEVFSPTFEVSILVESEPASVLSEGTNVYEFNNTIGPVANLVALDIVPGTLYEVSAEPTEYGSAGGVSIQVYSTSDFYRQWGFFTNPVLAESVPMAFTTMFSAAVNSTATVRWMAVREDTLVVVVFSYPFMEQPWEYDTTEVTVTVESTPAQDYILGSDGMVSLSGYDFTAYRFDVVEGYSYVLDMNIDYESNFAYATFINHSGLTPFAVTAQHVWCHVASDVGYTAPIDKSVQSIVVHAGIPVGPSDGMQFRGTLLAAMTGEVFLIVAGTGNVQFKVHVVDATAPRVAFTGPTNAGTVDLEAVNLTFSASDDIGLESLILRIYSGNTTKTYPLSVTATSFEWTPTEDGLYVLTLTATDAAGNTAVASLVVLVGNDPGSFDTGHDQGLSEGLNQGLIITAAGGGAALVVGLILGLVISKRRGA